jgi:tetratricopeptide (TPR) repeat protein
MGDGPRVAGACGAVVLLMLALSSHAASAQPPAPPSDRWLLVPFELAEPTARTYWLGEGVVVLIGDELERAGVGVLPRRARVAALDALRLPTSVALTRATYIRVGQVLEAPVAVFGRVESDERSLRISARRLDLASGQLAPEIVEEGSLHELFAICRRVAGRLRAGEDPGAPAAAATPLPAGPPLDGFEAYSKALLTERPEVRIRLLDTALEKAPDYDPIRLALWEAHADEGDHARALAVIAAVPDASPVARSARFRAALSLMELRRYEEAFATLRALNDARASAAVLNNLGVIQIRRGHTPQTGRATYFFNKAVELEPDDPDLSFNLGYAYWDDGDAAGAIYWLREALRRNPADADAHFVLAAALDVAGSDMDGSRERALARQLSARYARSRDGDATVPRGLERLRESVSRWYPARLAAPGEVAERDREGLVPFHLERARRFVDQGRDGDAEPELRRVLFHSPYHAEAHLMAGRLYLRSGRAADAIAAFRIAIWSDESPAAHVALGEALVDVRDLEGARAAAQRALALDPEHPAARALIAHLEALPDPASPPR